MRRWTHPGISRYLNEARRPHTCSRPCAFEEKKTKKKTRKIPPLPKTHHGIASSPANATHSRRRATKHVSHALVHTRPRFHRFRVCENRPRTALAISKKDECYTYIHTYILRTYIQTDRLTDRRTDRQTDREAGRQTD